MALTYVTGHDLTLTINSVTYANVCSSATLTIEPNRATLEVLSGRKSKYIDKTASLTIELYQDWGSTTPASVCEALWTATNTSPNQALSFSLAANGKTFSGTCYPMFPDIGGAATDALTASVTLEVDNGSVTLV